MKFIQRFTAGTAPAEPSPPAAERIRRGNPQAQTRNDYSSADGGRHVGIWESTEGAWEVEYSEWEYCLILSGRVRLTDPAGDVVTVTAGESLVIEPGFRGLWEVLEPTRKLYVIVLPVG